MNLCFYLAIDRLALGKSVVIEFIGPIAVAAAFTRTARNALALLLAVIGVAVLSGVELDDEPLGLVFVLGRLRRCGPATSSSDGASPTSTAACRGWVSAC